MARPPRAAIEPTLDAELFRAYEDVRRAFSRDLDDYERCNTLRDWVIAWLRAIGKFSDCISWSMDDDTALSRKMRACLPSVIDSTVALLLAWRLWWQRQ